MMRSFDKKLLEKFQNVESNTDNFIWIGRPEKKTFIIKMLVYLIGQTIACTIGYFAFRYGIGIGNEGNLNIYLLFFLVLFIIPALIRLFGRIFFYKGILYGFSNERIYVRSGFFDSNFKMIDCHKVVELELNLSWVDKYFKTGTIKIYSGNMEDDDGSEKKLYDDLENIENPYEVLKELKKATQSKT